MDTLASELLKELKMSARRWFIAFCVMVALEVGTIIGFVWYMTLPTEENSTTYQQSTDTTQDSNVDQRIENMVNNKD
jgi:hypothetical protein